MAKGSPGRGRRIPGCSRNSALIWKGIWKLYTFVCIFFKLLYLIYLHIYHEKFGSKGESLFGLYETCYICWPDAPLDFFLCLYLHGFILYTLRGFLKRRDVTPAISGLGDVLSISTNVGQCSLFPHLTRRTGKMQLWTLWPGSKIFCILGKCSNRWAMTQNEGIAFLPFSHPSTVTDGLWTADMGSLGFALLSWVVRIPPGCSRTVLHQICGWWHMTSSVLKQSRLNATETKIFFSNLFSFQWAHPNHLLVDIWRRRQFLVLKAPENCFPCLQIWQLSSPAAVFID